MCPWNGKSLLTCTSIRFNNFTLRMFINRYLSTDPLREKIRIKRCIQGLILEINVCNNFIHEFNEDCPEKTFIVYLTQCLAQERHIFVE